MKKNDILELTIDSLSPEARGLTKYEDKIVFVRDALPGEKVKAKVLAVHKNFIAAKSVEVLKASPDRVQDEDSQWAKSGYARLANYKYDKQLKFKKNRIIKLLAKNNLANIKVNDVIPSPKTKKYRNELVLPVRDINGQLEIGFYEPRTTKFIPINSSIITNEKVVGAILGVRDILRKLKIPAYNPDNNTGFIRDIDVRRSHSNDGMIVTLVTREKDRYDLPELVGLITENLHNVNGVVLNYNPHRNTKPEKSYEIFGDSNVPIWGNDYVEDTVKGISFKISPKSYFQANGSQLEQIVDLALKLVDFQPDDEIIDAYCGVGTIGLTAAKRVKSLTGIAGSKVAAHDVKENAAMNKITNTNIYESSVEQVMSRLAKNGKGADVIIIEPPTKGVSEGFIDAAAEMKPRKILYNSTNPDTLVRDLQRFKQRGYVAEELSPIDMAPQTPDMNCLCVLTPQN